MEEQENPLERDHSLCVVLPGGLKESATVHGSQPVMDLPVALCASHHLNPAHYTVELLSHDKNRVGFKASSPVGSLAADTVVLRPKSGEEKVRRPYAPQPSVRLLINYNRTHKAVLRVDPRAPLRALLPLVCDKCELPLETTVLLRDPECGAPLDLTETLSGLGLRELFATDTAAPRKQPGAPGAERPQKKQKDDSGFLGLFRRRKTRGDPSGPASPPAPGGVSSCDAPPAHEPKKRRAPRPPQSPPHDPGAAQGPQRSAESPFRRTKRRAPPPPCADRHQQPGPQVEGTLDSLDAAEEEEEEELRESDESNLNSVNLSLPSSSSFPPARSSSSSASRASFSLLRGVAMTELSDARCALAKVLTSSVSKGTLVQRLRNAAAFPEFYSGASFGPQRGAGPGGLMPDPPTEQEDQRKGMTTFKVVPSKTAKSVEDDHEELGREAERTPAEAREDPLPPDGSQAREDPLPPDGSQAQEDPLPPDGSQAREDPLPPDGSQAQEDPLPPDGAKAQEDPLPPDGAKAQEDPLPPDGSQAQEDPLPPDGSQAQEDPLPPDGAKAQEDPLPPDGAKAQEDPLPPGGAKAQEDPLPPGGAKTQEPSSLDPPSSPPPPHGADHHLGSEVREQTGEDEPAVPSEVRPADVERRGPDTEEEVGQGKEEQDRFPSPPPPIFLDEHTEEEEEDDDATASSPPKPPGGRRAAPSRFALAVALAVQRSRLQSGRIGPLPSPPRTPYHHGA